MFIQMFSEFTMNRRARIHLCNPIHKMPNSVIVLLFEWFSEKCYPHNLNILAFRTQGNA